jgi:membrane glycosyltransferase
MDLYLLVADSGLSVFGRTTTVAVSHRIERVPGNIADFTRRYR